VVTPAKEEEDDIQKELINFQSGRESKHKFISTKLVVVK
jgi:hypothetical protein